MKRLSFLALLFYFLAGSGVAQGQNSAFNGYWVTETFTPITVGPSQNQHQKMLLFIQPIQGATNTYRLYYYLWNKDFNPVVGPQFENGFLDPNTGWIYLGVNGKGRDIIKLENGRLFYFLSSKSGGVGGKTTILSMTHVDDQTGLQLQAILKKKQQP